MTMKHLFEFVSELRGHNKYKYPDDFARTFDNFLARNGFTEDTVTEEAMNWFAKNVCENGFTEQVFSDEPVATPQYITEMLHTVNIDLLIKSLNKGLGADGKHKVSIPPKMESGAKEVNVLCVPKSLYDEEKIADICDTMMWTFTQVYKPMGPQSHTYRPEIEPTWFRDPKIGEYAIIIVEPQQSDNVTDLVKKDCKGILYHVTSGKNLKSILKSGLRMKGESNNYRLIKNKTYFVCGESEEAVRETLITVAESKGAWDSVVNRLKPASRVIRIDVSDYNVDFYRDTYYETEKGHVVYSYAYFPPKLITDVTSEMREKLDSGSLFAS